MSARSTRSDALDIGGPVCTLIAVRHQDGQFGLYYHGGMRSSAMLPPPVYAKLLSALTRLADQRVTR